MRSQDIEGAVFLTLQRPRISSEIRSSTAPSYLLWMDLGYLPCFLQSQGEDLEKDYLAADFALWPHKETQSRLHSQVI